MPAAKTKAMTAPPVPPIRKPTPMKMAVSAARSMPVRKRVHGYCSQASPRRPSGPHYVGRRLRGAQGRPAAAESPVARLPRSVSS